MCNLYTYELSRDEIHGLMGPMLDVLSHCAMGLAEVSTYDVTRKRSIKAFRRSNN
jgi:hypothetical protein